MGKVRYVSVEEVSRVWQVSERSVRNYCAQGRVEGALLEGKTWKIPSDAQKPERKPRHSYKKETLLTVVRVRRKKPRSASRKKPIFDKRKEPKLPESDLLFRVIQAVPIQEQL